MKWTTRRYDYGDTRHITKFLLFPRYIKRFEGELCFGDWYWLTTVTIMQQLDCMGDWENIEIEEVKK